MKLEPIPVQSTLNENQSNTYSPTLPLMRVNSATLARLFNVSRTSIKRYVDAGKIQLDANGLADPKQAAQSVLESSSANRVKAKFFKTEVTARTAIEAENDLLKSKLIELQTKLNEEQAALTLYRADSDMWQRDYWGTTESVTEFIELICNDAEMKSAVNVGNVDLLQMAFDDLLDDLEQANGIDDANSETFPNLKTDDDELPNDSEFLTKDFFSTNNEDFLK